MGWTRVQMAATAKGTVGLVEGKGKERRLNLGMQANVPLSPMQACLSLPTSAGKKLWN
jgi:hypothetical protein